MCVKALLAIVHAKAILTKNMHIDIEWHISNRVRQLN